MEQVYTVEYLGDGVTRGCDRTVVNPSLAEAPYRPLEGEAGDLPHKDRLLVPGNLQTSPTIRHIFSVCPYLDQGAGHLRGDVLLEGDHEPVGPDVDPSHLPQLLEEVLDDDAPFPALGEVLGLDEDLVLAGEGGEVGVVGGDVEETSLHLHHLVQGLLGLKPGAEDDVAGAFVVGVGEGDRVNIAEVGELGEDVLLGEVGGLAALDGEPHPAAEDTQLVIDLLHQEALGAGTHDGWLLSSSEAGSLLDICSIVVFPRTYLSDFFLLYLGFQ